MDCSHDLYWIKDRNYRLQFVNKEYKKLFPTVDDFVGKTDHDLVDAVLADGYKAGDEKVMSSGQEFPYQENDKGELWFESIKIPSIATPAIPPIKEHLYNSLDVLSLYVPP